MNGSVIPFGGIAVGRVPRVVGSVTQMETLPVLVAKRCPVETDLVELRLDRLGAHSEWIASAQSLEGEGIPVIATVRHRDEGGDWHGNEDERLSLYRTAMDCVSAVDVELNCAIAGEVIAAARARGKAVMVSYHDFQQTPSAAELDGIVGTGTAWGEVVVKVAVWVEDGAAVERLRGVLQRAWPVPVCLLGMGAQGEETRVSFALDGSCLTYGYLDAPAAPGQLHGHELVRRLREAMPAYDRDRRARH